MNSRTMRWMILFSALAFASWALAQTGGTYELSWSTIDGGGGGILIYDLLLTIYDCV